jgi:formate dehydrogenase maturation protein FdhE
VNERPVRAPRADSREIAELKELKIASPELVAAIDMQLALVEMQRRVQSRMPLPWIQPDSAWLESQHQAGRPAIRFADIPLEWTDFRLTFRQVADILFRYEAFDRAEHEQLLSLGREKALELIVRDWYHATSGVDGGERGQRAPDGAPASLDHVLLLALRPFLARCVEALQQRVDLSGWRHHHCPYCGWEPDFAVITPSADRRLVCGRCVAQWAYDALACPFCTNDDRAFITSFATRDGRYRVYACDVCRRYLKAYDARNASRPLMAVVDTIATLPLDAAAIQRGYVGLERR